MVATSLVAFKTLEGKVTITSGNTLTVGPQRTYQTIQSAVNNASDNDTIEVENDSNPYHENVVVNRSVTITPYHYNNQSPTVVGGFNVTSFNVTINDFIIRDGRFGIELKSSGNTISANTITNNTYGLEISGSSNEITGNSITTNWHGLYVGGDSNILSANIMAGNWGWNFGMDPTYQVIDTSNKINGKSICYLVNQPGGSIPPTQVTCAS